MGQVEKVSKCVPDVPFVEDKKSQRAELRGPGKAEWLLLYRLGKWAWEELDTIEKFKSLKSEDLS